MSKNLDPNQFENIEYIPDSSQAESLYFPAFPAVESGKLDIHSLDPHNPQFAGMMVRNGLIPDQAGSLVLPGDGFGAYDLVKGYLDGDELRVFPADKSAVDKESRRINSSIGLVILSNFNDGTIRPVAEVVDVSRTDWNRGYRSMGTCALRPFGINSQIFGVEDLCKNDGTIIAKLPKRYF